MRLPKGVPTPGPDEPPRSAQDLVNSIHKKGRHYEVTLSPAELHQYIVSSVITASVPQLQEGWTLEVRAALRERFKGMAVPPIVVTVQYRPWFSL